MASEPTISVSFRIGLDLFELRGFLGGAGLVSDTLVSGLVIGLAIGLCSGSNLLGLVRVDHAVVVEVLCEQPDADQQDDQPRDSQRAGKALWHPSEDEPAYDATH